MSLEQDPHATRENITVDTETGLSVILVTEHPPGEEPKDHLDAVESQQATTTSGRLGHIIDVAIDPANENE